MELELVICFFYKESKSIFFLWGAGGEGEFFFAKNPNLKKWGFLGGGVKDGGRGRWMDRRTGPNLHPSTSSKLGITMH